MSKVIIVASLTIFAFAIILFFQSGSIVAPKPLPSEEGVTPILNAPANNQKVGKLDILFIGNSYTFMHSMPQMIINMAASDPNNGVELNIQSVTFSGARLIDHWKNGTAVNILKQKPWDFVILQDQSNWATQKDGDLNNLAYTVRMKALAVDYNKKVIVSVFKTWPKKENTSWYIDPQLRKDTISYEIMRSYLDQKTAENAQRANVDIVPASDYWLYIKDNNIPIELYDPDGSHPSVAGSYLNALVFYRYFTASDLKTIPYIPAGITPQQAEKLKEIAALGTLK